MLGTESTKPSNPIIYLLEKLKLKTLQMQFNVVGRLSQWEYYSV